MQENIWGQRRLELAWLSKLCRGGRGGSPSSHILQPSGGCGFLGRYYGMAGRRAVCNKPQKCNLCFHSSARLITGLHAKPRALNISRLQLAINQRKSGSAWTTVYVSV